MSVDAIEELLHGNRVVNAFEKKKAEIAQRIKDGLTTPEKVEEARKGLDMDLEEYISLQEVKSLAVAMGLITVDEGQSIYAALEGGVEKFNRQPVHIKVIINSMHAQLLQWKRAGAKPPKK